MDVTEDELRLRILEIQDYQLTHGMLLKKFEPTPPTPPTTWDRIRQHVHMKEGRLRTQESQTSWTPTRLAVSVLPTPFSKLLFEQAKAVQPLFNELYVRAANDHEWLHEVLSPLLEYDPFLARLWSIYEDVRAAGLKQEVVCGIFRSDYMIDQGSVELHLKQVEMNVFSASGFAHASNVAGMHRHIQRSVGGQADLPRNENIAGIADMLAEAHKLYLQGSLPRSGAQQNSCVLMVVQSTNFNIADERPIEYALWDRNVPCYRCEWRDILSRTMSQADGTLLYRFSESRISCQVSVVYYRAGYEAREYGALGCEVRSRLELSKAIKCPDIATHLTTCKTVQEALTRPGALARFVSQQDQGAIYSTFMEMYALDNSSRGLQAQAIATDVNTATNYVLKSNGDGGGHNVYREDIPPFLKRQAKSTWCTHTLMKLIKPPQTIGILMSPDEIYRGEVTSELGILGTCIWSRHESSVKMLRNERAGWTLKTKPSNVDGMMVVKGVGAFDCPAMS